MLASKRSPLAPDVPTMSEAGVPGLDVDSWLGIFAPAKTPAPVVQTINAAVNKVLTGNDMQQLLEREGAAAVPMTVAQLADLLPKEIASYRKMAQAAGMTRE